jgi:transglutaminase-like putative cysteine protease
MNAVRYRIRHLTRYEYALPVALAHHLVHLWPPSGPRQTVHAAEMRIDPAPAWMEERTDGFGNVGRLLSIEAPHTHLEIAVALDVTVHPGAETALDPARTPAWETVRDRLREAPDAGSRAACAFALPSTVIPEPAFCADYARPSFPPGRPVGEAARDLARRIHADFAFDAAATTVSTPPETVLRDRRGVCQDFAHVMIACLRSMGVAGRYVSGYLRTRPPPGQPRLAGADASHAWAGVWCGDAGWLDLDPTNDMPAGPDHVVLAVGRDYHDVSPTRGVILGGGRHGLTIAVDVEPCGA